MAMPTGFGGLTPNSSGKKINPSYAYEHFMIMIGKDGF